MKTMSAKGYSKYQRLDGTVTTADDPERGVWYSVRCPFWTDEWDTLKLLGGTLPVCPHCESVGMQATAKNFLVSPELDPSRHEEVLKRCKNADCKKSKKWLHRVQRG